MSNLDLFVSSWLDQAYKEIGGRRLSETYPYNLYYHNGALFLELACAGFAKDEISVKVSSATKFKVKVEDRNKGIPELDDGNDPIYHHQGISKRNFVREFSVTSDFDLKQMAVSYSNGLLRIKVPEKEKEEFEVEIIDEPENDVPLLGD